MRSFWYDNPGHSGFNSRRNPSFGISANGAGQSSGLEHQTRGAYRRIPVLSPSSPPSLLLLITGQFPTNSRKGPHANSNRSKVRLRAELDHDRTVAALAAWRVRVRGCRRYGSAPLGGNRRGDRRSCRRASETDLGPNGTPVIRPLTGNIWLRPRGNEHGHDARSRVSSEAADCKCDIFSTSYGVPNRRSGSPQRRIRLSNIDVNIARRLHITLRDVQRRIGCPGRSNGRTE